MLLVRNGLENKFYEVLFLKIHAPNRGVCRGLVHVCVCWSGGISGAIIVAMAQAIFFIFAGAMALFAISTVVVLFHFLHYRLKKDKHRGMILAFLAGSLALFFLELSALASADWGTISEIMKSYFF